MSGYNPAWAPGYPAQPGMYPTARPPNPVAGPIPTQTGYTQWLAEGGYPDVAESAAAYAAGQRVNARVNQSRGAVTTTQPTAIDVAPANPAVPALPPLPPPANPTG